MGCAFTTHPREGGRVTAAASASGARRRSLARLALRREAAARARHAPRLVDGGEEAVYRLARDPDGLAVHADRHELGRRDAEPGLHPARNQSSARAQPFA